MKKLSIIFIVMLLAGCLKQQVPSHNELPNNNKKSTTGQNDNNMRPLNSNKKEQGSNTLNQDPQEKTDITKISQKLIKASWDGDLDAVMELIALGANVNASNPNFGFTALMGASARGYQKIVELLLLHGADITKQDGELKSALIFAASQGHADIVDLLLKKGADINDRELHGLSAILLAAYNGYYDVVKILLNHSANPNDIFKEEYMPLPDSSMSNGDSVLMFAIYGCHTNIVELLLNNGADYNIKNEKKEDALILARKYNCKEIEDMLLRKGAKMDKE
jgi:ankyrin repeat protein